MAHRATVPSPPQSGVVQRVTAAVRSARAFTSSVLAASVRRAVRTPVGLRAVNQLHRRLGLASQRRFYYHVHDETCVEGPWTVEFAGRRLVLPLRREFRMAWTEAVSFHGHDPEIHDFYETAVRRPRPPRVFFDVGASYGLHSLKLLAHGVQVVSFEPNPACHPFFIACCERNGLTPELHAVAVGARTGSVELAIPGDKTYLGTVTDSVKDAWVGRSDVTTQDVPQVTLDGFVADRQVVPDLIKIDVEGSELGVLEGAHHLLEQARPELVLESWSGSGDRTTMFGLLASHGYQLYPLAFPPQPSAPLTLAAFLEAPMINFVARFGGQRVKAITHPVAGPYPIGMRPP